MTMTYHKISKNTNDTNTMIKSNDMLGRYKLLEHERNPELMATIFNGIDNEDGNW